LRFSAAGAGKYAAVIKTILTIKTIIIFFLKENLFMVIPVSQRPEAHSRKGAHSKKSFYLSGNYHLQDGNLHAIWCKYCIIFFSSGRHKKARNLFQVSGFWG
jgi:hypothetical protein